MAKPNYAFAKRQRELAKKAKKEAKRLRNAPSEPEQQTPGDPAIAPADQKSDPAKPGS